jgi:integrase
MPKQQEGQLFMKEGLGWYGRFYATVDGERVRVCRSLKTHNKAVARRKLARLIAEGNVAPEEAQRFETFEEAARRIVDEQKAAGMGTWKDRVHRLETHVFPTIGKMLPNQVKAAHIRGILDEARDAGHARQYLTHIKYDCSSVLAELWRSEEPVGLDADGKPVALLENVCARVRVPEASPEATQRSKKERAVLTDQELVMYLAWQHPQPRFRGAVLERQTMACVSRMFGGLRTSDLHAVTWDAFETIAGAFTWGLAPRKKGSRLAHGGKPQPLVVPEPLRPILRDWWERQGRPTAGFVFPKRRGDDAVVGKGRKKMSHAKAMRRDLQRALGLEVFRQAGVDRKGNPVGDWERGREPTPRELVLFTDTEWTRCIDFHSWRRSYNQALADAGVNAQQAKALAGHSSMAAHERYLRNTQKARTIPVEALPDLGIRTIGHSGMGTEWDLAAKTGPANETAKLAVGSFHAGFVDSGEFTHRLSQVRPLSRLLQSGRLREVGPGVWAPRVSEPPRWVAPARRMMTVPSGTSVVFGRCP